MTAKKSPSSPSQATTPLRTSDIELMIQRRAYEIYEATGREDGRDLDHWLQAEAELLGETAKGVAA